MKVRTYFSRLCLPSADGKLNVDHDVPFNYRVVLARALVTRRGNANAKKMRKMFDLQRRAWSDGNVAVEFAQCK